LRRSEEYSTLQGKSSRNTGDKIAVNENAQMIGFSGIKMNEKDKLTLIVRDNGIGFPEKLDFHETTSLGLQLVTTLVDQIEGNIALDKTGGTEFRISFFRS
jgi:two-component sensor histidine kinase